MPQTLHNPATGEVRKVPSGGTEARKLISQGWLSGSGPGGIPTTPTTTDPYIPTFDKEGKLIDPSEADYLLRGIPKKEKAAISIPSATVTPADLPSDLKPFADEKGAVDLVKVVKSGNTAAIKAAEGVFSNDTMRDARHLSKTPVTVDVYLALGKSGKKDVRVITPVSLEEYNKMSDREKAEHYIAKKGVSAAVYAKLGPGVRKIAEYAPTTWERLTPWKEELGETAEDLTRIMPRYVGEGLHETRQYIESKVKLPEGEKPGFINVMDKIRTNVLLGGYDLLTIPAQLAAVSFAVGGEGGKFLRETDPTLRVDHLKAGGGFIKDAAVGMGHFFAEMPGAIVKDPTKAAYYSVMLAPIGVGGVRTVGGVAKRTGAALHPYGIDPRALAVEAKIAWTKAPRVLGPEGSVATVAQAIKQQLEGVRKLSWQDYTEIAKVIHKPGYMKRRTAAVVKDDAGNILLGVDRSETPGVFSLVGGQVDPVYRPGQIGWTKNPRTGKWELDIKGSTHGQVKSETGIGLTDTQYLPSYSGFTTQHAHAGTYLFMAKAKGGGVKPTLDYVKKGELTEAMWWDGQSSIKVYPATYYILKGLADAGLIKANMKKVKMFTKDAKAKWQAKKTNADLEYGTKVKAFKDSGGKTEYRLKGDVWSDGKIISMPKVEIPWQAEARLEYRLSPMQTQMYDVLYHATADATHLMAELQQKGHINIKGKLYTSPQAAMNFLAKTAKGTAPVNPAIIAIRVPKNVLQKHADVVKTTWPKGKGVESEVVFKEAGKLYPTEVNFFAKLRGTSGRQMVYVMKDGKLGLRVVNKGKAVTGETFTTYRGKKTTTNTTRVDGKVYELEHPVSMNPGTTVPMYWLHVKGGVTTTPSVLSLYAVQLKAMREAIYDTAVTTGGIGKDLARGRKPRALQSIRLSYGLKGAFEPLTSPMRFTTRAYGDIKVVIKQLEKETQEALKYAKEEAVKRGKRPKKPKGEPPKPEPYAADYVAAVEQAFNKEVKEILDNPKARELIESNPRVFNDIYEVNLMRYATAFSLGWQRELGTPISERKPVSKTYVYEADTNKVYIKRNGKLTDITPEPRRGEVTTMKEGRELLKPGKKEPRRTPPGKKEKPERVPPVTPDREKTPPTEPERVPPPPEDKRRVPPPDDDRRIIIPDDNGRRIITEGENGTPPPPKKRPDDFDVTIEHVSNIPEDPGTIIFPQGIVNWRIKPPYRRGTIDIKAVRRAEPEEGKGSPEEGLRVLYGKAPHKVTLRLSRKSAVDIVGGKRLQYYHPAKGPGLITKGKVVRQRPGSLITA